MTIHNPKEDEYRRCGMLLRGAWSGDSQLGQRQVMLKTETVLTGPDKGSPYTEFSSQIEQPAAFKLSEYGAPKVWTVSLYPDFGRLPEVQDVNFSLAAELKFGSGGAMQTVVVDVENGVSVSAPMNAVEIRVDQDAQAVPNNTVAPMWDYLVPPDLSVMYTIAQGTSLARLPRRTISYTSDRSSNPDVTTQNVVPIPPFASHVQVLPVAPLEPTPYNFFSASNQVLFFGSPNNAAAQPPISWAQADQLSLSESISIPANARGIAYRNLTVDDFAQLKFRFLISI